MSNVVTVQGQNVSAQEFRKAREAIPGPGDGSGKSGVEFVNERETAHAADGTEIGLHGNLGYIALTGGLKKGAPGRMECVYATNPEGDKLLVREREALAIVFEGGENAECGLQKHITNKSTHRCE
ncbi:MAG: hypothetical protein KF833_06020 [Verrucomicrobiae bacterium]|nr:hypothetical protein [Verrucomicrobiae bacterium]